MKRALLLFTIVVSCVSQELYAQKVAVKTNLLSDAFFSPNLGVEVGFAPRWTLATILPDADVKIYLTASSLTRAKRRYLELQEKGTVCNLDEIQKDIEERDQRDMNREISPLRQAEDAVLVDSSDLTIQQVVDRILQIFRSKTAGEKSHES